MIEINSIHNLGRKIKGYLICVNKAKTISGFQVYQGHPWLDIKTHNSYEELTSESRSTYGNKPFYNADKEKSKKI